MGKNKIHIKKIMQNIEDRKINKRIHNPDNRELADAFIMAFQYISHSCDFYSIYIPMVNTLSYGLHALMLSKIRQKHRYVIHDKDQRINLYRYTLL